MTPRVHACRRLLPVGAALVIGAGCAPHAQAVPADATGGQTTMPGMPMPSPHTTVAIPPEDRAEDGIARVEVAARIDVALHWTTVHQYHFGPIVDPSAGGTASFVDPRGLVVTSPTALELHQDRLTVYAVNQAWHQAVGLPLPKDPYQRTRAPGNPMLDAHLLSCYRPNDPQAQCAVFITREIRVYPYSAAGNPQGFVATPFPTSGGVAVLSTATAGKVGTVALADPPQPGASWTSVGWGQRPTANAKPATMLGHYDQAAGAGSPGVTNPARVQLTAGDSAMVGGQLGTGLAGAVLLDDQGGVTGMLAPARGSADIVPVTAITTALDRVGAHAVRGTGDTSLDTGLALVAKDEFRHALPWLRSAAESTSQGAVAVRYQHVASARAGQADDMSDLADAHVGHAGTTGNGSAGRLLGLLGGLLLAALAAAVLLWRRRRHSPAVREHPVDALPRPPDPNAANAADAAADAEAAVPPMNGSSAPAAPGGPLSVAEPTTTDTTRPPRPPGPASPARPAPPSDGSTVRRPNPVSRVEAANPGPAPGAPPEPAPARAAHPELGGTKAHYCSQCGTRMAPGDRFCFLCGARARATT